MSPISDPIGIEAIDRALRLGSPTIDDFLRAASSYVIDSGQLATGLRKKAQLRLSHILGGAITRSLQVRIPELHAVVGEKTVGGALRNVKADVSEYHVHDGLRLAIEIKPINLAVGRAIWNRFGDIRTFAVNVHLKFPFAVVGGVLAIPSWEESTKADGVRRRSTTHLIERATQRLARAGNRETEGDAPHLLEAIAVIAYDPGNAALLSELPAAGLGLRYDEFVDRLASAYKGRFEPD